MDQLQFIGKALLIAICGTLPTLLVLTGIKERQKNPNINVIKLPIAFLWIGIIVILAFWIPSLTLFINGSSYFSALMFFLFGCLGAILAIFYVNRRIYLDENSFTFKSFWGRKTSYQYSDVDKILLDELGVTVIVGKKKICLEKLYVTSDLLATKIAQEKRDYTNNKTVQMGGNYILISTAFFIVFLGAALFSGLYKYPAMIVVLVILLIFMIGCRTFKINYDTKTFVKRNIWGISRTFEFSDITEVHEFSEITVLKVKKRYIIIESHALGLKPFLSKALIACRKNRKKQL